MPSVVHLYTAKIGNRSSSKAGTSTSTSLLIGETACSERKTTGANVPVKDAEEEFLARLIFSDAEGFEGALNELNGGYSHYSNGGGGGGEIKLAGDGDVDAGADLQALQDEELCFVREGPCSTDLIPSRHI
ncbi:hypothetical protein HOY82DRAFT_607518 [Tuber indicum]|nr:hypothetical protein HOY82DRAFT_607518 [Tuber indicum]